MTGLNALVKSISAREEAGANFFGESVAPDVAVTRVRAFLQELLCDGGLERREHDRLLHLGHAEEQPICVSRSALVVDGDCKSSLTELAIKTVRLTNGWFALTTGEL